MIITTTQTNHTGQINQQRPTWGNDSWETKGKRKEIELTLEVSELRNGVN